MKWIIYYVFDGLISFSILWITTFHSFRFSSSVFTVESFNRNMNNVSQFLSFYFTYIFLWSYRLQKIIYVTHSLVKVDMGMMKMKESPHFPDLQDWSVTIKYWRFFLVEGYISTGDTLSLFLVLVLYNIWSQEDSDPDGTITAKF